MKTLFTVMALLSLASASFAQSCCTGTVVQQYPQGYVPTAIERHEVTAYGNPRWVLTPAATAYDHKDHWNLNGDASTEGEDSRQSILLNADRYHLSAKDVAHLRAEKSPAVLGTVSHSDYVPVGNNVYLPKSVAQASPDARREVAALQQGVQVPPSSPAVVSSVPVSVSASRVAPARRSVPDRRSFSLLSAVVFGVLFAGLLAFGAFRRVQFQRDQESLRRVQDLQRQNISVFVPAGPAGSAPPSGSSKS